MQIKEEKEAALATAQQQEHQVPEGFSFFCVETEEEEREEEGDEEEEEGAVFLPTWHFLATQPDGRPRLISDVIKVIRIYYRCFCQC